MKFIQLFLLLMITLVFSTLFIAISTIAMPIANPYIMNQLEFLSSMSPQPDMANLSTQIENTDELENISSILSSSYVNSSYGVKIDHPANWVVREGGAATIYHNQSKTLNVVAEILAPVQSSYYDPKIGASHNSIRIIVEDYNTFGDYVNENIQNYISNEKSEVDNNNKLLTIANKRIGAIGMYCHNFDLKRWIQNASLSGSPAHQIFLDYSYDIHSKDATEIWSLKNNKIYIIEFVAQDKYYNQYFPVVVKMIESFRILA